MEPGHHAMPEYFYLLSTNSTIQPKQENVVGPGTQSWDIIKVFLVAFVVSATIATLFGNALVLASYSKYTNVRTPSNTVILSLSIVDLLLSVVFVTNIINIVRYPNKESTCGFTSSLSEISQSVMVLHLCLISFERFVAVRNSLTFHTIFTLPRVLFALLLTWLVGLFVSLGVPYLLVVADPKGGEYNRLRKAFHPCDAMAHFKDKTPRLNAYAFISLAVTYIFPLVFMIGCYGYILHVAKRHRKHIAAQRAVLQNQIKVEIKGTVTAALVVGIFLLCFTPLAVVTLCRMTNPTKFNTYYWAKVTQGLYLLANSSAFLNPVIYAWRIEVFRKAFGKMLCRSSNRIVERGMELPRRSNNNS